MKPLMYKLVDKIPVPVTDTHTWAEWFESGKNKHVAFEELKHPFMENKNCEVSTVFLGSDHNYRDKGSPILFETMVFGGDHDQYQERYCTWDEAEQGHKRVVQMIINGYAVESDADYLC